jgi:arginase family enzyme
MNNTDCDVFLAYIAAHIDLTLRIKQRSELDDATPHFTTLHHDAAWHSTNPPRVPPAPVNTIPLHIRNLVTDKRRARSRWQRSRNQGDRAIYNRLKRNLQAALRDARNATVEKYITSLSPDDTSL